MITLLPKLHWRDLLWMGVRIIILVYVGLGLFLFLFQRSYIYFPQYTNFPVFSECPFFDTTEQFEHRGTQFYETEGTENVVIVYYHGNAGTACDRYETRELLAQTGAKLLFVEYPGYGGDAKETTEETITNAVDNIIDHLAKSNTQETKVIVVGRSIGTGAAAYHAQSGRADTLILVSPFTSLPAVAQLHYAVYPAKLLVRDRFDNVERLRDYAGKVGIIHGAQDKVVPHTLGKALFDDLGTQEKKLITIEGTGHNNLMANKEFRTQLLHEIHSESNNVTIGDQQDSLY